MCNFGFFLEFFFFIRFFFCIFLLGSVRGSKFETRFRCCQTRVVAKRRRVRGEIFRWLRAQKWRSFRCGARVGATKL